MDTHTTHALPPDIPVKACNRRVSITPHAD